MTSSLLLIACTSELRINVVHPLIGRQLVSLALRRELADLVRGHRRIRVDKDGVVHDLRSRLKDLVDERLLARADVFGSALVGPYRFVQEQALSARLAEDARHGRRRPLPLAGERADAAGVELGGRLLDALAGE